MKWSKAHRCQGAGTIGTVDHKSCLDCEHFEVGGMPNRRCALGLVEHIFMSGPDGEMGYTGRDVTTADVCPGYVLASDLKEQRVDAALDFIKEVK